MLVGLVFSGGGTRVAAFSFGVLQEIDRTEVKGNILECLTTAKRSVSSRCNAALDAAYLRQ